MADRTDHSDPLWDTRRARLDRSLFAAFGTIFISMLQGVEMASAIAPPAFIFAGLIIGAYFGAAEYGRVHGGTTVEEEVVESPGSPPVTTTKTTEKTQPVEGE